MRIILFLFLIVVPFPHLSFAQDSYLVDSLELQLKIFNATSMELGSSAPALYDTTASNILNELSKAYWNSNSEKALDYAKQSLEISKHIGYKNGIASANNSLGAIKSMNGDYLEAMVFHKIALKIREEIGDQQGIAGSYNNIGIIYQYRGNLSKALENYLVSLKIREKTGDKKGMADIYDNIGGLYQVQGILEEALKYHLLSLRIREEIGDKNSIAGSYNNIGNIYADQGKYPEALKNYSAGLKLAEETDDKYGNALLHNSFGNIYQSQGNYSKALKYYFAFLRISEEIGDKESMAVSYLNVGGIYTSEKKYSDASHFLNKALSKSKEIGSLDVINSTYSHLATLDSARGNFKAAFEHYKLFITTRDSLVNSENTQKTTQLQMQYDFDKKEAAAKAEQDKKDVLVNAEIKRQTLIRNATLGGVGVIGMFSFLLVRSANRRRKSVFEKQVSEVEMKALRSQMNPHFIFNSLQSVKKYILENAKNDAAEYLSKFSALMRLILENSRKQEVTLEKDLSALELYMQLESLRFQNRFQFAIEVDPEIDKEDTMIAPLLLQPFVENSIIHGISSKENGLIKVKVSKAENMIKCTVEDNGIGRDQSVQVETGEKKKRESLGMKITQERLNIINQLKKVKTAVNIFDLKDDQNNPGGLRIELLLPFETAF